MKRRRVKITGIGPVTPAGIGREEFWKGILEPVSRVRPYTKLGEDGGPLVAAYITGFDVRKYLESDVKLPKGSARQTQFAVAGAILALKDAGISQTDLRGASCAVCTGSSLLDFGGIGNAIAAVNDRGPRAAQARVVYTATLTSIPDAINNVLGISARTMTIQTTCCSGLDAIGRAAELIASGEVDIALCGGTESPLHRFPLLELRAAGLTPITTEMHSRIARPFDLWRTTGVVSEGACMFILEPENSPRRGYSYIDGYGFANDPAGDVCGGLQQSGRLALASANLRSCEIDVINAWAPGHRIVDEGEARAMMALFKDRLDQIPTVSIKGAIGASLGSAPAIQVAAAALGQDTGILPPTVNWEYADPACPLNLSNRARMIEHDHTLVNAHGVGSVNSSVVLRRC